MRVWLVTLGEPLPIDGPQTRLLRTGFLARALRLRGHEVTWFSNRFSHHSKVQRDGPDARVLPGGERLILLNSRGYRSNVSVERYLDHRDLAKDFLARAPTEERPDLIVASMPTIDLCKAAVEFGQSIGVPTVVDIRDLWPDSIWDLAPRRLRPAMALATLPLERQLRSALTSATALTSHVADFIEWARRKTHGGRPENDRVFPLGYESLSEELDTSEAHEFWASHGLDLGGKDFLAVYVGTISRQCEFGHVIEAARALSSSGMKFVLCGTGDTLPELQTAAATLPNMVVPGWCSHAQISVLLENAGAGLMPYRRLPNFVGAVPNKALEYMAGGVPIVWSLEEGALAELIRDEEIGVTYDLTANGLVNALSDLRNSGEKAALLSARARYLFNERFRADRVYDEMVTFLESLVVQRSGAVSKPPTRDARDLARHKPLAVTDAGRAAALSSMEVLPLVTVVVPCRNEARFIESCLNSIVHNDYPEDRLQILVIDGQSEDGTGEIVERFRKSHGSVTLIENQRRITPAALNLGVKAATGDYVVWMSAHNRYDRGYIRSCIEWALSSGADNVGGIISAEPREKTLFGRAIALALAHHFGNGGSKFRTSVAEPVWADTVFGGCYRRDVFTRVGLFNEKLVRGQDFEFNVRLRRAGLNTLLVPTIHSTYFARSGPLDFIKHNWDNGVWAVLPFRYTDVIPISFRHLVPMFFVGSLIISVLLALAFPIFRVIPLVIIGAYLVTTIFMSAWIAFSQRDTRLLFVMPIVFGLLHITYGLGSLWAAVRSAPALIRHAVLLSNRRVASPAERY